MDVKDFCKTCDVCHKSKRDFAHRTRPLNPLNPLPVAQGPFKIWNIDHKDLCRKTNSGSVAVLCCMDAFSGWPILAHINSMDAETTAKTFLRKWFRSMESHIL